MLRSGARRRDHDAAQRHIRAAHATHTKRSLEPTCHAVFNAGMTAPDGLSPTMCSPSPPQALIAPAADGYPIACSAWRWASGARERPVVVVCPATSVRARYYERFAHYLHAEGFAAGARSKTSVSRIRPSVK